MSRAIGIGRRLADYIQRFGVREHPALVRCRIETDDLPMGIMQIGPEQGAFMALMARTIGATRYLEIGTFTGYSALAVALALPTNGRVVALDVSREFTDRARVYWKEAGVAERIDLRIAPAQESLDAMIAQSELAFDIAFIDAVKPAYDGYYVRSLKLVRPGGLILLDNVLRAGAVADSEVHDSHTEAIRVLNRKIHADERVDIAMVTIGDGLTIVRKK